MSIQRTTALCLLSVLAPVLAGCAISGPSPAGGASTASGGGALGSGSSTAKTTLGGSVHGGQQPISGAAVTLWAAGTSGTYGTGATSIATTNTDANGNFSFNNGGASPCTNGQYLYITSLGGNPGGGANQYAALMAALPAPCGPGTAGTFVNINEATTVASVTALEQFMSIAPSANPAWTIGAPAANVTGMANAFTQIGNLVSISSGTSSATTATATYSSVTYTTTIMPDSSKIYALADILAACVNTNGNSTCTSLFADVTPAGGAAPTDTIQAAYDLATNAGGLNLPAHSTAQGEPYYLCSTYIGATPPFQPYSSCTGTSYPTDWAIGVSWSTSNGTIVAGTATPYNLAIDGLGNIWTAYGCSSSTGCVDTLNDHDAGPAYVTEFNPQGQVQFTPVAATTISAGPSLSGYTGSTNYSLIAGRPFSLAIDTNNNAWFNSFYGAAPSTQHGVIAKVAQGGASTGYMVAGSSVGAMAIDGNNNIYFSDQPVASRYYISEMEYNSGNYSTFDEGIGRATSIYNDVWTDSSGYAWSENSTCSAPATVVRANTADEEAASGADEVTNESACPSWPGAADSAGGAYFANGSLYHLAISGGSASKAAPVTVSETAGTGTTNGGLDGGAGVAVDGLGNVWVANGAGGVSEFSYNGSAFTPLSPSGTSSVPAYGFGTSYFGGTHPLNVATDASGNVWVGTETTSLWYLVGIAGPTVTPTAAMLKNSYIGSRPGSQVLVSLAPALNFTTPVTVGEPLTATLTNTGTATANIGTISIGGTNQSNFTVSGTTCGSTLAIGGNCTITVTFSSAVAGSFSAALNVPNNSATNPVSVNLTATASNSVALSLDAGTSTSPTVPSITFPSQAAGSTSTPQAVVVTNTGSVPLTLSLAMTGSQPNLFSQTGNCGSSVAANASCDIYVSFSPRVAGSYSAALTLTDNAGTGSQSISLSGTATAFTVSVNTSSSSSWVIDNGAITFNWNASSGNLTSWVLDGYSDQLVDTTTTSNGQPEGLYMDNTGSFANMNIPATGGVAATPVAACTIVGGTQVGTQTTPCTVATGPVPYLDWSLTIPDTANSGNDYTFVEHWIVFPNDPGVHTYVQLVHSASDAAASVGQVQWVFRDNLSTFTHTYSVNAGLGILGVQDIPQPSVADTSSSDPGRAVQNAAEDLHGFTDLPSGFTREFYTKYDYAGYEYLHQGQGVYGPAASGTTYGIWTVLPKLETLVGGPTKQDLFFTNNIDMIEAYSDHEDEPINMNTAADVAYNRLFGPYYIHVNTLGTAYNQNGNTLATQADMYADALSAGSSLVGNYDNEAQLVAAGYVPSTGRGSVSIQVNGVSGPQYTAWAVLSDPNTNFQVSFNGMQYWADISSTGAATFSGVAPGTYRLSVYVLGQWGEYRQDGIVVTANNTVVVPPVTWAAENFAGGTGETVFSIGTPDRSAHEFLHGHNTATGKDDREFYGAWNYWMDFQANQGAVVYYATAVNSTPATNNLAQWNYNHWGTSFNPGLYAGVFNSSDDTTDAYQQYPGQEYAGIGGVGAEYAIPTYVAGLPGASGTNGAGTGIPAWQVHFATPSDYASQTYVELSVAVACDEGSYVVALNGHSYTWSRTNESDCMARSGLSGYTQWFVMEWPTSDLVQSAGGDNVISIGMSQPDGASDDALRLELTNSTSNPASTSWHDYTYISGSVTTLNNDAVANP